MAFQWYALHSQSRKEDLLWRQLQVHNIECFYPMMRVTPVNPRSRKVRPYFPGYLFVHVDVVATGVSTFQYMPYATGLVSFGGEPAPVPEALIQAIRQRVEQIQTAGGEQLLDLHSGDTVVIENGPFSGYEAIFDARLPGSERVRVLLKMLNQRSVPVELQAGQIQKKRKPKP